MKNLTAVTCSAALLALAGCWSAPGTDVPGSLSIYSSGAAPSGAFPSGSTYLMEGGRVTRVYPGWALISARGAARWLPGRDTRAPVRVMAKNHEYRLPESCYSGSGPQAALSPSGRYFACLDGIDPTRVLVSDLKEHQPTFKMLASDAIPQITKSIAFVNETTVAYLVRASKTCDSHDPLVNASALALVKVDGTSERTSICAAAVFGAGDHGIVVGRKDEIGGWKYSIDSGATWRPGFAIGYANNVVLTIDRKGDLVAGGRVVYHGPVDAVTWGWRQLDRR